MGHIERITVAMPEALAAEMQAAVDSGTYATTGEIVREAVAAWSAQQDRQRQAIEKLRALVAEAEASESLDGEQVMAELRAKFAAKIR
jgi:antitoxin ParD1/3/4